MGYIKGINGLRAFAVALVIFQHYIISYVYRSDSSLGSIGVTVFFVISGFLITGILIQEKEDVTRSTWDKLIKFYSRRILRIFPIYYLVLSVGFLSGIYWFSEINKLWHIFYATNIYIFLTGQGTGYTSHFWSLDVEEQFYIIWPALVLLTPNKHLIELFVVSILLAAVSLTFRPLFGYNDLSAYALPFSHFDSLGSGALLSVFVKKKNQDNLLKIKPYMIICGVIFTLSICIIRDLKSDAPGVESALVLMNAMTIITTCLTIIYIFLNQESKLVKFLEIKFISGIGVISYGLYLYHLLVPELFTSTSFSPKDTPSWINVIVYFFTSICISILSWLMLERKILKHKNGFEKFIRISLLRKRHI